MIDSPRLERALIAVARRYAPALVPAGWMNAGDYPFGLPNLARRLASEGALVISAEIRPDVPNAALTYKDWADAYTSLYTRLCAALFPSFMTINAFYVDQGQPPIAVIQGICAPTINAIGGYVAPYVASRAGARPSDLEVRGIIDIMLEALEAGDLARDEYVRIRDDSAAVVRRLLDMPLRHIVITPPARGIFGEVEALETTGRAASTQPFTVDLPAMPAPPETPPLPSSLPEPPPPPPTLPESPKKTSPAPTSFPPDAVPIFFNPALPAKRDRDELPPPPVPPLPTDIPR